MVKSKCLLAGTVCTLLFGLLLLALGIALPIVIQQAIDTGLDDLWMQPSGFASWGATPGKLGIKIVREYSLFKLTNPGEVILAENGGTGRFPLRGVLGLHGLDLFGRQLGTYRTEGRH